MEATWDASGHKRSFRNKPHFSKTLVLAEGLVSKVYGCVNAPLTTEVVCKADVEQLMSEINFIPPAKPVLSELCVA